MMHNCRIEEQFFALAGLVLASIQRDGKKLFADWLEAEYLMSPWNRWYYTCT